MFQRTHLCVTWGLTHKVWQTDTQWISNPYVSVCLCRWYKNYILTDCKITSMENLESILKMWIKDCRINTNLSSKIWNMVKFKRKKVTHLVLNRFVSFFFKNGNWNIGKATLKVKVIHLYGNMKYWFYQTLCMNEIYR